MESFEHTEEQHDDHAGEQQPDALGAETAPVDVPDPTSGSTDETPSPEEAGSESPQEPSSESSESSDVDPTSSEDSTGSTESGSSESQTGDSSEASSDEPQSGLLAGTGTEQQPGVGGLGDHPAPAAMRDPETGDLRVHGQPPSPLGASGTAPVGDSTDETDESHALDPEAAERLNAVSEPEQIPVDRPDIGTPTE